MITLLPAYSITIKVGEKLFAGHVDNSLAIVPQYEPILRKSLGGRFDLDFVSVDLDMRISGLTYERTSGEAATHNDFADLRAACSSPVSVAFVYGAIVPGNIVLRGNAKLSEYQETAGSGKISGQWSCRLRSVRGSVQEEVVPPEVQDVKYGLLYNWYAATDVRNICALGWRVPTRADADALEVSIGGSTGGGKLKEAGLAYWNSPNTEATNEVKFNARGASTRDYSAGTFSDIKTLTWILTSEAIGSNIILFRVVYDSGLYSLRSAQKNTGYSIRLVKDSTTLSHGQTGTYTGNDGRIYRTICIGTQEWLADNLCETLYLNGDPIPEVTDNAAWAALTTGALCAYYNDWSNV